MSSGSEASRRIQEGIQIGKADKPIKTSASKALRDRDERRHSREDALSDRQFETLVESTYQIKPSQQLECRMALYLAGRLGLRGGEIAHLSNDWVDWSEKLIVIPEFDQCTKGENEGEICGYCRRRAIDELTTNNLTVTSSPAVNGGASLPQRGTRSSGSVSRLALPASMGRVSTLGRERLVALSRALPSESVSSRSIFNRPLSPNRSNLAVLCRHGSHLVGQRPSTGLPARRKHGWSAAHIPRSFAMGCGVTLSKHTFADDLAVSVGVPAVPLAAVASRNGRDSRPP
jgi:hypothetical protein